MHYLAYVLIINHINVAYCFKNKNKKIHKSLTCPQKIFLRFIFIQNRIKKKTNEKSITKEHQVAMMAGL